MKYVERFVQADGGIYAEGTVNKNYETCIAILCFKEANRNPDNVRRLLNAEETQFNAWISGKESIPANAQTMIAGVLEKSRRDPFTDLPPEDGKQSD